MKKRKVEKGAEQSREREWERAAALLEAPGTTALEGSRVLSPVETDELLGRSPKTRLISIRLREVDLAEVKQIAKRHGRKYQQLINEALSQFLLRYRGSAELKRKA